MPYLDYNVPLHRTGFRPVGETSPWAATQLSGFAPAWPRQVFSTYGGRQLHGTHYRVRQVQRAFSPNVLGPHGNRSLMGLGQAPGLCYDALGNPLPCSDPGCGIGPCGGGASAQGPAGQSCSDAGGAFVMCGDPACRFGPCVTVSCPPGQINQGGYCVAAAAAPGGTAYTPGGGVSPYGTLGPGPSPRVNVPLTLFPPTAPPTATPVSYGQPSTIWNKSTIVAGVPDVAIYGLGILAIASLAGGGGYYTGRRR